MKVRIIKKSLLVSDSPTNMGKEYSFTVDEIEATRIDYNVGSPTNPTYTIHYDVNGVDTTISYSAKGYIINIVPYLGT